MEICVYCGDARAGKFICCGEVHFEEITEENYEKLSEEDEATTGENHEHCTANTDR